MRIAGKTDKGNIRADNQDRYLAGSLANGVCFGFVCDGMGGAAGGSVASERLSKMLEEYLFVNNENKAIDCENVILSAIDTANGDIYSMSQKERSLSGMGTTVSGVTVKDDLCTAYNIGDSRVYVLRAGTLTQITEDHSVVQQLYRQGAISEEEMALHPQKNLITRAVGVTKEVRADVSEINLQRGDMVLCASDGLTNFVSKDEIIEIMGDEDFFHIPEKLIERALNNGSTDNVTAVVLEY